MYKKHIINSNKYFTSQLLSLVTIAMLTVTSPIVINVPTRGLLAVETNVLLFCGWQNLNIKRLVCKQ